MRLHEIGLTAMIAIGVAVPAAAQPKARKIDEALSRSLDAGCATEQVIIRTKRGFRSGVSQSLQEHGDRVTAVLPSIDAVAAELHCDDLASLAGFDAVISISKDAEVGANWAGAAKSKATPPAGASRGKRHGLTA